MALTQAHDSPHERLRQSIRVLMAIRGVRSQTAFAREVGLPQSTVNKKMRGTPFHEGELETIADYAGVEVADLWYPDHIARLKTACPTYEGAISFDDIDWHHDDPPRDLTSVPA